MSYFTRHVFICTNARNDVCRKSCNDGLAGEQALDFIKGRAKRMGLIDQNNIRISKSGCLGRCDEGPAMVIYPEGRWYTFVDETDLQDILEQDLAQGQTVTRLLLDQP